MKTKSTTTVQHSQHLIAGLLRKDHGIEFFGIPETMEVQWMQYGKTHPFSALPQEVATACYNSYASNLKFQEKMRDFKEQGRIISTARAIEIYVYFMFGGLDDTPDYIDGCLQEPENYRHSKDCISLDFKVIKLNGSPLKRREITMIDGMVEDYKHDVIAMSMGITTSTYNQHKKELFTKTGTQTTVGLLRDALRQGVAIF